MKSLILSPTEVKPMQIFAKCQTLKKRKEIIAFLKSTRKKEEPERG